MTIKTGESLPNATFKTMSATGIVDVSTDALLRGKKVARFGLPDTYTPVCSAYDLPGYVEHTAKLRAEGFIEIACVSVNAPVVMAARAKEHGATGKVTMLCGVDGSFTRASGLVVDLAQYGLPGRSEYYSMVVDNGVVMKLEIEEPVFDHDGTSAACFLRG